MGDSWLHLIDTCPAHVWSLITQVTTVDHTITDQVPPDTRATVVTSVVTSVVTWYLTRTGAGCPPHVGVTTPSHDRGHDDSDLIIESLQSAWYQLNPQIHFVVRQLNMFSGL